MKFLSACSKIIAAGFAAAFIIATLLSLIIFNVQGQLLDSDTYKNALEEQEIYTLLPTLVAKQIATSMTYNPCLENPEQCEGEDQDQDPAEDENGGPPAYLKNLSQEQWELILTQLLTPEWTQTQTESALDQLFTFLDSNDNTLSITISLVDLKANLTGQKGMDIIKQLVNAQPPCTEQLLDILFDIATGTFTPDELLLCAPPEELLDELAPEIEGALEIVIQELPDEVNIEQNLFGDEDNQGSEVPLGDSGINVRTIRFFMRFSPLLSVLFLGLLTLFGVRSLKGLLLWWGIPFMTAGLLGLTLALMGMPILNWGWTTFAEVRIPAVLDPEFVDLGFETVRLVFRSLLRTIALQAGLMTLLGIILTGASIFLKGQTPSEPID
jgi:hypothetical protein